MLSYKQNIYLKKINKITFHLAAILNSREKTSGDTELKGENSRKTTDDKKVHNYLEATLLQHPSQMFDRRFGCNVAETFGSGRDQNATFLKRPCNVMMKRPGNVLYAKLWQRSVMVADVAT